MDEDAMTRAVVSGLRARGVDVTTVFEEGMSKKNYIKQLEQATRQGRTIYTFNVSHFCQLHSEYIAHRLNLCFVSKFTFCYNLSRFREATMEKEFPPIDNVVAIPFPMYPRRVIYGELAKVLDFLNCKERHMVKGNGETDNGANGKTVEEVRKLSVAEQKLWVIKRLLEVFEYADQEDLEKLYEVLSKEPPKGA